MSIPCHHTYKRANTRWGARTWVTTTAESKRVRGSHLCAALLLAQRVPTCEIVVVCDAHGRALLLPQTGRPPGHVPPSGSCSLLFLLPPSLLLLLSFSFSFFFFVRLGTDRIRCPRDFFGLLAELGVVPKDCHFKGLQNLVFSG